MLKAPCRQNKKPSLNGFEITQNDSQLQIKSFKNAKLRVLIIALVSTNIYQCIQIEVKSFLTIIYQFLLNIC